MRNSNKKHSVNRGFALIEVLVSLMIFSLGVVGLVGMQTRALQVSTDAQDRSTAAMLANNLSSEMLALQSTALNSTVINAWITQVRAELPNAEAAVVQTTAGSDATITVRWRANSRKTTEEKNQFITRVVIPK